MIDHIKLWLQNITKEVFRVLLFYLLKVMTPDLQIWNWVVSGNGAVARFLMKKILSTIAIFEDGLMSGWFDKNWRLY